MAQTKANAPTNNDPLVTKADREDSKSDDTTTSNNNNNSNSNSTQNDKIEMKESRSDNDIRELLVKDGITFTDEDNYIILHMPCGKDITISTDQVEIIVEKICKHWYDQALLSKDQAERNAQKFDLLLFSSAFAIKKTTWARLCAIFDKFEDEQGIGYRFNTMFHHVLKNYLHHIAVESQEDGFVPEKAGGFLNSLFIFCKSLCLGERRGPVLSFLLSQFDMKDKKFVKDSKICIKRNRIPPFGFCLAAAFDVQSDFWDIHAGSKHMKEWLNDPNKQALLIDSQASVEEAERRLPGKLKEYVQLAAQYALKRKNMDFGAQLTLEKECIAAAQASRKKLRERENERARQKFSQESSCKYGKHERINSVSGVRYTPYDKDGRGKDYGGLSGLGVSSTKNNSTNSKSKQ